MNRHLKDADNAQRPLPRPGPASSLLATQAGRNRRPWVNWLVVLGVLFGVYIYFGHNFLQKEYTWPYLSGDVAGRAAAAATTAATEAEAAKAKAVAEATAPVQIAQAASQAAAAASATFPIQVELAAAIKTAEIAPTLELQQKVNDLENAKALAQKRGLAYQECLSQGAATTLQSVTSQYRVVADKENAVTLADIQAAQAAGQAATEANCGRFKNQEEEALTAAAAAASAVEFYKAQKGN